MQDLRVCYYFLLSYLPLSTRYPVHLNVKLDKIRSTTGLTHVPIMGDLMWYLHLSNHRSRFYNFPSVIPADVCQYREELPTGQGYPTAAHNDDLVSNPH